ncbi:SHC-transforming protein 3 isoform X2 [Ixodes scapularis]|nr:SHC-transforming protein 3 isoform X2 [Ixodes scapularis]
MATAASWGQVATPAPRHQHHQQAQQQQQEPCHHQLPQGFVSRPPRGWLHTDQEVLGLGVTYRVRYIGCLDVKMSMKCLDFDTRSLIAKECITRVCEAAGLKAVDKKRKVDRRLQRMLAERPNMDYAGSNVNLCVTSSSLKLSILETGQAIADHNMPNISFASGGDAETLDFVAYVAKDGQGARACLVLECGGGLAQDVITTIGQAFELRFREFMRGVPAPPPLPSLVPRRPTESTAAPPRDDPEYYNDLPGKMPPEAPPPPVPPLPDYRNEVPEELSKDVVAPLGTTGVKEVVPGTAPQPNARRVSRDTNLIDLSGEELPPAALTPRHEYVNMGQDSGRTRNGVLDPFDMHPFVSGLPLPPPRNLSPFTETTAAASAAAPAVAPAPTTIVAATTVATTTTPEARHRATLEKEAWFHGAISRKESEGRLAEDGDFLVRESQGNPGQFVLTGMQGSARRHLLLVDPAGVVRTKDRTFDSVSHLVNYHRDNALPIISAESALVLKTPVPRPR